MIEAYKLTRDEVHNGLYDVRNVATGETGSRRGEHTLNLEIAHRAAIRKALRDDLPVPARVLDDYPDLKPRGIDTLC